jgi:uncharacterized protein (TIGR03437 family)
VNRIFCSVQLSVLALLGVAAAGSLGAQTTLQVNPAAVTLSAQAGSTTPVTQIVAVNSSGDAAGNHLNFYAYSNTAWLSVTASGITPGFISASANPSGLQNGTYSAQIYLLATGASNVPVIVPVTFTVGQLSASPTALTFSFQSGGAVPAPQTVAVSGPATPVGFTAAVSVESGAVWLQVAPTSGTTPGTVNVSLNAAVLPTLASGTYNGTLTLTPTSGSATPLLVPVTLTVAATPQLTVSPASLSFCYQIGGTNNVIQQPLALSTSGAPVSFFATTSVDPNPAGVQWLLAAPVTGVTPATLTVSIAPGALPAGTYSGKVTIAVTGAAPVNVNVTLTVSTSPLLSFTPNSLSFSYQVGAALPAAQTITPSSTGAEVSYTVSATTTSGGNWLAVSGGGTTPNPASVSVSPGGLTAGTYSGTITFTASAAGNSPQQIPVSLIVTNNPLVQASPAAMTFVYQLGKAAPAVQNVSLTSSTGATLNYSVTASTTAGGNWLAVSPVSGATPGVFSATAAVTGMTAGTYSGTITITATNPTGAAVPNSPLKIPVTYYVSQNALLQVSPGALTFTVATAGTAPAQIVQLSSTSDPLSYTITSKTDSGGPWLAVGAQAGTTPGNFPVSAVAFNLSPGTYTGSITITATNPSGPAVDDSPVVIPVTLQVVTSTLSATPASLTFTQAAGGTAPPDQTISVSGSGGARLNFTAVASNTSGVNWLTVTPGMGATPATLTVSADGSQLSPGTYPGTITITSPGAAGSPQIVQVTLTVTAAPAISLTPATLNFSYQVGGTAPADQTVQVASSSGHLAFTAAATVNGSSGNWLSVTPASGNTPASLTVKVNPASLTAGTYTGKITVTAAAAGNSPQSVGVTLVVTPAATPLPTVVQNAASQATGPIAPGEIISIYGTNLGPAAGAGPVIDGSSVGTEVAGIQVKFDNNYAPLLYVSATQINAIVPFELYGLFQTHMQILNSGVASNTLDLMVAPTAPGLFTVSQNGAGQGAILNYNSTVNSATNRAAPGSIIVLYATGGGQTTPPGDTGHITPADGTGLKNVPGVTVTVGGQECEVIYAGSAPGFVEGAVQINVRMPDTVPAGAQPVVINVGGVSSQAGVTVAVH